MKILLISNGYPPKDKGGVETYVHSIAHLLEKTHKVYIFAKGWNYKKKNYTKQITRDGNITVITIINNNAFPPNFAGSYIDKKMDLIFAEAIREIQPDIIHINHLIGLSGNLPLVAKKFNIPFLFTIHDFWYICTCIRLTAPSGKMCPGSNPTCIEAYFRQNPPFLSILFERTPLFLRKFIPLLIIKEIKSHFTNKKSVLGKQPINDADYSKLAIARYKHFKRILNISGRVIVPSSYTKKKYANFGINNKKISLLPNGISLNGIGNSLNKKSRKIRFAYFGTIVDFKGVHTLLEAFKEINNKNVELRIYGDINNDPAYYRMIKELANKRKVHFMGVYARQDLGKIFSSVDVVVIPSIAQECFPTVALEAQAFKIPVIASQTGSLPEMIKHKINGLTFESNNSSDLKRKINMLVNNPGLISKLSANSKTPLDIKSHTLKLLNIYKTVIKDTG